MNAHVDAGATVARLLARARGRYAAGGEQLEAVARSAVARLAEHGWAEAEQRVIAAHVSMAALAAERLPVAPGRRPLIAHRAQDSAEPAEQALAEHVHARLQPEVLLVVALRATCEVPAHAAAEALHLTTAELAVLEAIARHDAESLTLRYHDELICEPADLAALASSTAVTEAVRRHLHRCRSCRREFHQRVWHVLGQAGGLTLPLPELSTAPAGRARRMRRALGRPRGRPVDRLA